MIFSEYQRTNHYSHVENLFKSLNYNLVLFGFEWTGTYQNACDFISSHKIVTKKNQNVTN